jgi:hypothetical protein
MESRKPTAPPDVPPEVSSLQRQVERWRQERRHREPMPEQLWHSAARLAQQHSVARIARWIRLDYYTLKERVESLDHERVALQEQGPAFVELALPTGAPAPECTIELEHPRGGRMRIHVKGAGVPDLAALSRSFWGEVS